MIIDSHIHIDNRGSLGIGVDQREPGEWQAFKELIEGNQLRALANAACPAEYRELAKIKGLFLSFGIHPWQAEAFCIGEEEKAKAETDRSVQENQLAGQGQRDFFWHNMDDLALRKLVRSRVERLEGFYKETQAAGEMGMDSVWCNGDLRLQREVFLQQLELAEALGKPVVLHTKGQEQEIAAILSRYGVKKLVHWYSCDSYLEAYVRQDCYFTVGPNYASNPAVQKLIRQVPLDRLLVESDGLSAIRWAWGQEVGPQEVGGFLRETMKAVALAKGVSLEAVEQQMEENFSRLL
ncbi:TatD family hydrolase [Aminipila butyrica]|uniref:TatD family hydrolase n=1 Tax=Aminipila butyrica TaxID=433296 RepID=A0A858BV40_9FIRM|nr:TatD family hydrolase [Aminipila butyrica]QIB68790.1 TatD family hydrolase [Aminipila butyrica]